MIKRILFLSFVSLMNLSHAAQVDDHSEIVASAVPMLKKLAKVLDEKVIDSAIISYCASYGNEWGTRWTIKTMESVSYMWGGKGFFDAKERFEDNIGGGVLGAVAGYHTGRHIVYLRHKFTDSFFPQLYDLSEAALNACKTMCENSVTYITRISDKKT